MENGDDVNNSQAAAVSGKRYEWRLLVGSQWLTIDNDHVIETHYCHPGATGITINTSQGKVFIDFENFQTTNTVQRLSFLPQNETEEVGWYFRDNNMWCEYGSQGSTTLSSSVSSRDVEHQYTLNPQGSFRFTVGSRGYRIEFSTMSQINCVTGLRRNVRRRPKFTSSTGSLYSTSVLHTASSTQASNGGYKWEFMGEEGEWTEYEAHVCSLDSAAIEAHYQLNPQGQLPFKINRFSYTLDFSNMCQVNDKTGTTRPVRRTVNYGAQQTISDLTAGGEDSDVEADSQSKAELKCSSGRRGLSHGSTQLASREMRHKNKKKRKKATRGPVYQQQAGTGVSQATSALQNMTLGTKPQWQFEGNSGSWYMFKHRRGTSTECSVASDDIERTYQQNPSGTMTFQVSGQTYELDFTAMIQTNLTTNMTRKVRRV
uniref:WWE domain-containing protein n=1 Tax=Anabas testudineus TaxID=64144 RepID=A0A3Q1K5V5_ANATE